MDVLFTAATEDDFDFIMRLHKQQEWGLDVPRALRNFIEQGNTVVIAFLGDERVGKMDLIQKKREGISFLYIERLIIEEKYRNKGIGKKFIEYALQDAKKRGLEYVDVAVREENNTAMHLYETSGFISLGKKVYMRKKV